MRAGSEQSQRHSGRGQTLPPVCFWDMDHTIIANDCDVSWKEFLIGAGLAPASDRQLAQKFWDDYAANRLNWDEFIAFQLRELPGFSPARLAELAAEHFARIVRPRIYPGAVALLAAQRAQGSRLCLLTATNRIVAAPLAEHLGFDDIVATELEISAGCYTGRIAGVYCGGEGKRTRLLAYCRERGLDPAACLFVGDSGADLPALHSVGYPVVVNPMPILRQEAERCGWQILQFTLSAEP